MSRVRLTEKMANSRNITVKLDQVASELEDSYPQMALAIDRVSDILEGRKAGYQSPLIHPDQPLKSVHDASLRLTDLVNELHDFHPKKENKDKEKIFVVEIQKEIKKIGDLIADLFRDN